MLPYKPSPALASPRKGKVVYVRVLQSSAELIVPPPVPKKIVPSQLLTGGTVPVVQTDSGVTLMMPQPAPQRTDTIIKLTLEGPAEDIPALDVSRQPQGRRP